MSTSNSTESISAGLTSPSTANMTSTTATTTAYHNLTSTTVAPGNNSNNTDNDDSNDDNNYASYAAAAAAQDDDNRNDSYKTDDNQSNAHTFNTHDLPITPNMVDNYKAIIGGYDLSDPKLNCRDDQSAPNLNCYDGAYDQSNPNLNCYDDDDFNNDDGVGPQRQHSEVPELPPKFASKDGEERKKRMVDYASDNSSRSSYATIVEKYNYTAHSDAVIGGDDGNDVSDLLEKLEMGNGDGDGDGGVSTAVEINDEIREEEVMRELTRIHAEKSQEDVTMPVEQSLQDDDFNNNNQNNPPTTPDDDNKQTTFNLTIEKPPTNTPNSPPPRPCCTLYRLIILAIILLILIIIAGISTALTIMRSSSSITDDDPNDDDIVIVSPSPSPSSSFYPSLGPTIGSWSGQPTPNPSVTPPVSQPTPAPSEVPTTFDDKIRAEGITLLLSQITNDDILTDPSTPQYAAMQWIILTDPLQLPSSDEFQLTQRYVLAVLYYATSLEGNWKLCGASQNEERCGENDEYFRFLSGVEECQWYGVACGRGEERGVRSLIIRNNRLRGYLPPEISSLSQLQILSLSHNALTTPPTTISLLTSSLPSTLLTLELNNNDLSGSLPSSLATRLPYLKRLSLSNNKYTGTLPSDLFVSDDSDKMSNLTHLDLERNGLSGTIPSSLFQYGGQLIQVDLSANKFSGTIDSRWGGNGDDSTIFSLPSLRELLLHENRFSGTLPSSLFSSQIMQLSLGSNQLMGTIPDSLFDNDDDDSSSSSSLEYLHLGNNDLNGTLSTRFGALTTLKNLILWKNRLSGTIPREMGNMTSLELLQLQYNHLTGTVPMEICAATPTPLAMLGVDCLSPSSSTESSPIPPKVECDCCTTCFVGYE